MDIFIKTLAQHCITITVNFDNRIEDIKAKILSEEGTPPDIYILFFNDNQLEDGKTLKEYSIRKGSILHMEKKLKGGGCVVEKPSEIIGFLKDDIEKVMKPINPGKLTSRYIRNTNCSRVYEQKGRTCYAYAASSAYINTIMRIYGSKEPPSFEECYKIACYNGPNGGEPLTSIQLLEKHFQYGICCMNSDKATILDAIKISLIVSFSTSKIGWKKIGSGELIEKPDGPEDGWHAAVVEGYDFDKKCLICKNSWGGNTAKPRFDLKISATHQYEFVHVYFTLNSIKGKTTKKFEPKINQFIHDLNGFHINCGWMNEETAIYSSDYICEIQNEKQSPYNYFGYKINEYIIYKLSPSITFIENYTLFDFLRKDFYFIDSKTIDNSRFLELQAFDVFQHCIKDSKIYNLLN